MVKLHDQRHFQVLMAKCISLKKCAKINYRSVLSVYKPVLRKDKWASINPNELPKKVSVKPEKLQDIEELLKKHYGSE